MRRGREAGAATAGSAASFPLAPARTAVGGSATSGAATLAEASRDRLARPLRDPKLWKEFEEATGERVDPDNPPTWAELIVAKEARQAVTGENTTREAKELREAAEGSKNESARVALLLSLDGLPRTNAVSGR